MTYRVLLSNNLICYTSKAWDSPGFFLEVDCSYPDTLVE
jgi:hypothetical protein